MEHLTKQQIVLLTLFISFVTSMATGIVTVALMDQAPSGVTSTIDHIIERTVEQVTPASDTNEAAAIDGGAAVVDSQTQLSNALATLQKSVVIIKNATGVDASGAIVGSTTGIGVVVSKTGLIVADKAAVAIIGSYIAVLPNGTKVPVQIVQSQNNGDLVFLSAQAPAGGAAAGVTFLPAVLAAAVPKLGQTVLSLSGGDSSILEQGIITTVNPGSAISPMSFATSIDSTKLVTAGIFFDTSGRVIGIQTLSGAMYPVSIIESALPPQ
jgi:hypothetical protein